MRCLKASMTAAVALLAVSVAMAQNQNFGQNQGQQQQGQQQQGQAAQGQSYGNLSDMQIAAWLLVGNHEEIVASQLAEQRASSQKVKDLARQMGQQHSDLVQHLMQFAGPLASPAMAQAGQAGAQAAQQNPQGQQLGGRQQAGGQQGQGFQALTSSTTGQAGGQSQGLNFVTVIQQIGQQCEQSLSQDLSQKQGAEFDKCFVGQQITAHMQMLDKLRVLRQYASPQLQQVLAQGEQATQHHLDQLKSEMKSLESSRS